MLRGASEKISLEAADQTSKQSSTSSLITLDQRGSADDIFISISGMIGAGKSTLATALATELGLPIFYEPVADNEYLQDFYKDMSTYAFPLQVYLLNRRFQQHQHIIWQGKGGVQDRTIYEDTIFARVLRDQGHMSERDFNTYQGLFSNMSNFMKKPTLIVHLDVTPEESKRRIDLRSRTCEGGIPLDYLKGLHAAYEDFLKDISKIIPVIKVNYEEFQTAEVMAKVIVKEFTKMSAIRCVRSPGEYLTKKQVEAAANSEEAKVKQMSSD